MLVPLEVLPFLKCKDCAQYLSATPVKIYTDRRVKCYRCSKNDPQGVVSVLYGRVAEYLKFPCVNHRQGCDEILSTFQTMEHEGRCLPKQEYCPVCRNGRPTLRGLRVHAKSQHPELVLQTPDFALLCDDGDRVDIFFYEFDRFFVTFYCDYDGVSMKITVVLNCPGQSPRRTLKCRVDLYSIENLLVGSFDVKVLSDINKINASDLSEKDILMENYPRGVVMVKFELKEDPVIIIPEPSDNRNYPGNQATITWEIPDISRLLTSGEMSSTPYYVNSIPWRIVLKKTKALGTNITCLGIYLRCDKVFSHNYNGEVYKVLQEFTLVSCDPSKNVTEPAFTRDDYRKYAEMFGSSGFLRWDKFVAPENGYIHEGHVKLILKIDVFIQRRSD